MCHDPNTRTKMSLAARWTVQNQCCLSEMNWEGVPQSGRAAAKLQTFVIVKIDVERGLVIVVADRLCSCHVSWQIVLWRPRRATVSATCTHYSATTYRQLSTTRCTWRLHASWVTASESPAHVGVWVTRTEPSAILRRQCRMCCVTEISVLRFQTLLSVFYCG